LAANYATITAFKLPSNESFEYHPNIRQSRNVGHKFFISTEHQTTFALYCIAEEYYHESSELFKTLWAYKLQGYCSNKLDVRPIIHDELGTIGDKESKIFLLMHNSIIPLASCSIGIDSGTYCDTWNSYGGVAPGFLQFLH
jgi:hypothetical protein